MIRQYNDKDINEIAKLGLKLHDNYVFSLDEFSNEDDSVMYININNCYKKYKDNKTKNKLYLLGALLISKEEKEKRDIINSLFDNDIRNILINNFI